MNVTAVTETKEPEVYGDIIGITFPLLYLDVFRREGQTDEEDMRAKGEVIKSNNLMVRIMEICGPEVMRTGLIRIAGMTSTLKKGIYFFLPYDSRNGVFECAFVKKEVRELWRMQRGHYDSRTIKYDFSRANRQFDDLVKEVRARC